MKIGVGYCNQKDAFSSGQKAARLAVEKGGVDRTDLAVAFCGGKTDARLFFAGLQSVLGPNAPIVGGSAVGIITNDDLSYEGCPAGVAVVESRRMQATVAVSDGLDKGEKTAGRALGMKLRGEAADDLLLMFYDSIKTPPTDTAPPILNASIPLVEGIEEGLGRATPIIGAGVLRDHGFGPTDQFCGTHVGRQTAVGVLLSGGFTPYFRIAHGCAPKDGIYYTVTKCDGPFLYEVNGEPVVEIIDAMYGQREWRKQRPVNRLTIGINYGDKYGDFAEGSFVNRLISGILPDGKGIVLFEPDLQEGMEILFMIRNGEQMIASAKKNASELMEAIISEGKHPAFGLYIDCAGRTAEISHTLTEEACEVQQVFNQYDTPLLGFYSGVEVAPLLGRSRGLDWTGVLMVLARDR